MSGIREALESAMGQQEETPEVEAPAAVEAAPEPTPEPVEVPEAEAQETPAEKAQRARDEAGRFARRQAEKAPAKPATVKPTAPAPKPTAAPEQAAAEAAEAPEQPKPAPEAVRAPQSWRPAAREHWAKLPAEVQAEVARREREVQTAMQGTAEARRMAEGFQRTVEPYRALLPGEPMQVVGNLLQTFAQLQTAPTPHKAALLAQMTRNFGVPIEALDAALAGQPVPQGQQGGQAPVDPRALAAQVEQQVLQRFQAQRQQAMSQQAAQQAEAFIGSGKAEFLADVREEMADILEVSARRGRKVSLEEAYSLACQQHPEVSKVLKQREAAVAANATQASTQRARAAASSVRSQPATGPAAPKPSSLRGSIEAAVDSLTGR